RRRRDRLRVTEVELDAEQARIPGRSTRLRAQVLEPRIDRAHRRDDGPALPVEMRRGGEAETARGPRDDDGSRRAHRYGRLHMPSGLTGFTCGRPSGWPEAHVAQ